MTSSRLKKRVIRERACASSLRIARDVVRGDVEVTDEEKIHASFRTIESAFARRGGTGWVFERMSVIRGGGGARAVSSRASVVRSRGRNGESRDGALGRCRAKTGERDGTAPHYSVMMDEILSAFRDVELRAHVDGTLGAGGHAQAMIRTHPEMEHFIGFDVDASAHAIARPRLERAREDARGGEADALKVSLVEANFRQMAQALEAMGGIHRAGIDGVVLDLGVSSMHLDRAERGFSFMNDGPLDMRMGPSAKTSAEEIVNAWPEEEIGRILKDYGEERHWRLLAKRICERRAAKAITTTRELVDALGNVPGKWGSIHPATRTFQGIRIAVNDELGAVEDVIPAAIEALRPGGRLAIISFHSLEDSIVKKKFRFYAGQAEPLGETFNRYMDQPEKPPKVVKLITRKPLVPSVGEVDENVRSRSAKLRVCEKL